MVPYGMDFPYQWYQLEMILSIFFIKLMIFGPDQVLTGGLRNTVCYILYVPMNPSFLSTTVQEFSGLGDLNELD